MELMEAKRGPFNLLDKPTRSRCDLAANGTVVTTRESDVPSSIFVHAVPHTGVSVVTTLKVDTNPPRQGGATDSQNFLHLSSMWLAAKKQYENDYLSPAEPQMPTAKCPVPMVHRRSLSRALGPQDAVTGTIETG